MSSRFKNHELLPLGLVADILSVSKETVRKWAGNGRLKPAVEDKKRGYLYKWQDLADFPEVKAINASNWHEEKQISATRAYRAVELFAGAGGLALGLEKAGFETVVLNENNKDACKTLSLNRPSWNVICDDIENIDFNEFKGIDFVSGGFPCQAFSYAGKRFGFEDTRGTLFFEFARAIKEINPKVFLGENVRGLLTHDSGKTIAVIKAVISELGYTLVEPHILKAIFYGVPQKRERLALVGVRNDLAHHLKKFAWPSYYHRVFTVRDALIKGELYDCDVPDSEGVSYAGWRKEILEHVPQGGYWRNLPIDLQKKLLKGSFHLAGGKTGIGRRLSWDEPSLTLTCAPAQNQTGRCHPEETRPLTVREYARIQTFPDDWRFSGSVMSQYRQIGNAVPVNLAAALGRSLIALLNSIEGELPKEKKEANLEFLDSFVTVKYGVKTPDKLVQGMLFDANSLYLVDSSPVTLLGTYRKVCRKWIIENNLYNYPVKEEELDSIQELLAVRRLVLARKRDQLLSFNVTGYSLVRKKELAELGYSVSKRSSEKQRYILYSLEPADSFPIKLDGKVVAIVGKGVRV